MAWIMRFENGMTANCATSYNIAKTDELRAIGPKGGLRLEVETQEGRTQKQIQDEDQFTLEIDRFSQCAQEDKTPFTPARRACRASASWPPTMSARLGRPGPLGKFEGKDVFRGARPQGHEVAESFLDISSAPTRTARGVLARHGGMFEITDRPALLKVEV